MGIVRMGPPQNLILATQLLTGAKVFIETGTFRGDTARWASQHFLHVVTIEASDEYYAKAVERFSSDPNVTVLHGNSRDRLQEVVDSLEEKAIFWLDAHWSGGETYGELDECPILDEINLANSGLIGHAIFVDDARLFLAPPPLPHDLQQWPNIADVLESLQPVNNYVAVFEDVIISVPKLVKDEFSHLLQQQSTSKWNGQSERSRIRSLMKRVLKAIRARNHRR